MNILFFGDIVGKIGRHAIASILPELRQEYNPDVVIANVENLAHGKGVTEPTIQEMIECGIHVFTTGNHISGKNSYKELLENMTYRIIRPANYPPATPGSGYVIYENATVKIAVVNLMGRVFFREILDDPFRAFDAVMKEIEHQHGSIPVIVDWHAEASSEKIALGWHADGRATAILGTHTHVPTADARILPHGTGFICDVGMVGARDSMLGVEVDGPLTLMRTQLPQKFEIPESGIVQVNSVYLEIDTQSRTTTSITRVDREVTIE